MKTFLVVAAALSFVASVSAEPVATLRPRGRVNDFAHAFNEASRTKLESACREIDEKAYAQVAVVTINSLDGANIYDYSLNLFKQWGIGIKPANRGVLILLAVQDHQYRITVGSGLDSILKEGNVAGFGLEAVPFLKRGDYGTAALLMTSRVGHVIADDAGVTLNDFAAPPPTRSSPAGQPDFPASQPIPGETRSDTSNAVMTLVLVGIVLAVAVYVVIQYLRRRQEEECEDTQSSTRDPYVDRSTNIFVNSAATTSLWSSADTSSTSSSSSFGGSDSGSSGSCDSGSGGGGDTSGGGAGGNW